MPAEGFVDLQVNGYAGADFSDPDTTVDRVLETAETLAENGTVGFLATLTTRPREILETCAETIATAIRKQGTDAHILGIHLEGPFLSPEQGYRGVHPADAICPPDLDWFRGLQRVAGGHIRLITIAPEYDAAAQFIRAVVPNVIVSAGHTNCSYAQLRRAIGAGLTMATHIGNGCRQTIDRHNNPVVNLLACSELTLSFISDGTHLPEAFLRMLVNCRPVEKLIVVSDSVKFAGLPPGRYTTSSGAEVVLSTDGRLCLAADPEIMAGSSANMLKCMNTLASLGLLPESELWKVGFVNPLKLLDIAPESFSKYPKSLAYDRAERRFSYHR